MAALDQSTSSWSSPLKNQAIERQIQTKTLDQVNLNQSDKHKFQYISSQDPHNNNNQAISIYENIRESIDLLSQRMRQASNSGEKFKGQKDLQKDIQKLKSLNSHLIKRKFYSQSPKKQNKTYSMIETERKMFNNNAGFGHRNGHNLRNLQTAKSQDSLLKLQECKPNTKQKHKFQNKSEQDENLRLVTTKQNLQKQPETNFNHKKQFSSLQKQQKNINTPQKQKQVFNSSAQNSNYKAKIQYDLQSDSSPSKFQDSFNNTLTFRDKNLGGNDQQFQNQDKGSEMTFNYIQKYLDDETQIALKLSNSQKKLIDKVQFESQQWYDTIQSRQDEIIRKLMQSNSNFGKNDSILSVPKELLNEIDEYGLDSISILKQVINQFDHLFRQSKGDNTNLPLQKNQVKTQNKQQIIDEANVFTLNNQK